MRVTFGASTTQCNGSADDADPATPPTTYPTAASANDCKDGPSYAKSIPPGRVVGGGGHHIIHAEAGALLGPNPAGGALPNAASNNKVIEPFAVTYGLIDTIRSWFGWTAPFSMKLELAITAKNRSGPGEVRAIAWLKDAAGRLLAEIQKTYEVKINPTDPTLVDVKPFGGAVTTIPQGGTFSDVLSSPTAGLRPGNYSLQSELNVTDKADGLVELAAEAFTTLNY